MCIARTIATDPMSTGPMDTDPTRVIVRMAVVIVPSMAGVDIAPVVAVAMATVMASAEVVNVF